MSDLETLRRHMVRGVVDATVILAELGVEVLTGRLPGELNGTIGRIGRRYVVRLDDRLDDVRRRFAAAHELAHYLLHRDLIEDGAVHVDRLFGPSWANASGGLTERQDMDAARMAVEIMLPAAAVRDAWSSMPGTDRRRDMVEMADIFGMTTEAVAVRLETLGLIGYMLWVKGISPISADPQRDEIEMSAKRWYTINEPQADGGPCRYASVAEAERDGRDRLRFGSTDFAVTIHDAGRENWNVFDRPADAIDIAVRRPLAKAA